MPEGFFGRLAQPIAAMQRQAAIGFEAERQVHQIRSRRPSVFQISERTNGVAEGPNAGFGALLVMEFDRDPIRLAFDRRPGGRAP